MAQHEKPGGVARVQKPQPGWLDSLCGMFADEPEFKKVVEYGRAFPWADRPLHNDDNCASAQLESPNRSIREHLPRSLGDQQRMLRATPRLQTSCSALVKAAAHSAQNGPIHEYLTGELAEVAMRSQFAHLKLEIASGTVSSLESVIQLLRYLDKVYKATRFCPPELYRVLAEATVSALKEWKRRDLLNSQTDSLEDIANVVADISQVVRQSRPEGDRKYNPFSLITKFLHFIEPEGFVIWDNDAAMSVWMWSLFAIGHESNECAPFLGNRLWRRDREAYLRLLQFYTTVWNCSSNDERTGLTNSAAHLEKHLRQKDEGTFARVTVLDVIDKHLWIAKGNPIILGLARIPESVT